MAESVMVYASHGSSDARHTALEMHAIRMIIEREACLEALEQLADEFASIQTKKARPWKLVQNLTRQYRKASVAAVEGIRKWQVGIGTPDAVFLWKQSNYLHKMCTDTESIISHLTGSNNPLLAPISLTDPLLHEDDAALLEGLRRAEKKMDDEQGKGAGVEVERLCAAMQSLFAELQHVHVVDRPSSAAPSLASAATSVKKPVTRDESTLDTTSATMQRHLDHARQVLVTMEGRRKELVEQMQIVQTKMDNTSTMAPSKTRALQTKYGAWNNELKGLMGDMFKRRNELMRQEAAFKMHTAKMKPKAPALINKDLQDAVEADRLVRDKRLASLQPSSKQQLSSMTEADVYDLIKALGLESAAEKLRSMGIDGGLLAVSTDADLIEVGVAIRLHRVKILRHVQSLLQ
ncbi:hypothetical protein DYB37_001584 [Aphanomyces astaci]|uniref:SAM domain-containing protein n=1 Tax=Aphanomyces astaci TaxID=112090 RepID=A0A418DX97_APHAT|nr:hypothetical protein DYB35_006145 [Aphanomyces astaci]RHZ21813.1 hypothetical protein DYB37_001584 [Aphanomyces astaci]